MYDFWVASEKRVLPRAGGFLDQPAPVMAALRLLDLKHRIWDHIVAIEQKEAEQVRLVMKGAKSNHYPQKPGQEDPDPDNSLVPLPPPPQKKQ